MESPIEISDRPFCGLDIEKILNVVNFAHRKYGRLKFKIVLDFGHVMFIDKLTYIFLECICYYLIEVCSHPVLLSMNVATEINTLGINSSPLLLLNTGKKEDMIKFTKQFCLDIYGYHFRRLIDGEGKRETNYLGQLYQQIDSFLKPFGIEEQNRDEVGLVITELVGNAEDHAHAECLIDIDVAPNYAKIDSHSGELDKNYYYGINIAIINFSDRCLGDDICENIIRQDAQSATGRYKKVLDAYRNHALQFSNEYTEKDFCNIVAFQNRISGRKERDETGGTGLTKLIKSLQEKSDTYRCYVISGEKCINFYKEVLEYDEDGWLGFNEEHDFFNRIPTGGVHGESLIYMPGTAYNLNFVMKGEKIDESGNYFRI